jgi:electron transfer flavoprotein beta subunit
MALQIIVCIKSVIMQAPKGRITRSSDSCELNPYDLPALEMALRLREEHGGTVTALSMGPEPCAFVLHEAMAMGVDRSVLVCDSALKGSDTLATSTALASAIKKLAPFDLVLFGTRSADSDTGQVGPQTAVLLDSPLVTGVHAVEKKETGVIVARRADGFLEKVLTIGLGSVQPRDMKLFAIEVAFEEGDVEQWCLKDLGLSMDLVGEAGSGTKVLSMSPVDRGRKCQFLSGSAEEQAEQLIKRLVESGFIG